MLIRVLFLSSLLVSTIARPPEETNEIEAIPSAKPTPDYKKLYNYEKKKNAKNAATATAMMTSSPPPPQVEEYYVEHEISEPNARRAAKEINLESLATQSPGCNECTRKDMEYCAGTQVISDHCCCDKRYYEAFPYVPHTCYLGKIQCKPLATDCGEYMRIRECCCDKHLSTKWKAHLSGADSKLPLPIGFIIMLCLYYVNQFVNIIY